MATEIHGFAKPGFESVKDAFAHNFERDDAYRELGSSLAVYVKGELVVDLHAGWRDAEHTIPWTKDTLVNIWSATKGVAARQSTSTVSRRRPDKPLAGVVDAAFDTSPSLGPRWKRAGTARAFTTFELRPAGGDRA